ncbi:Wadjet anti-phage system protein JetD domain-containing protein [Aeromonas bivalvium]|uniref:Wadjet anti-phage system protein JetD domain-containing protein n=1 Tax=Aeromonas bivalvium TaxID=440079 RepID=UPI0038D0AA30
MGFFERAEIRALSEKLLALATGQGILLNSVAGRELDDMLGRVGGVQPVGRSARRQLTERGRAFLTTKLAQAAEAQPWSGEVALAALGGQLPATINGATLSGLWLRDCKAALSPSQLARATELGCQVLADEVIRLRTLTPLRLVDQEGRRHDMTFAINLLGELALPERALAGLRGVEWQGRQLVTVENKGAFVDYPLQEGELLLYVPGRNTALAKKLLPLLPESLPWAHFGDLDQRGLEIAAELAQATGRPLALWLPANLADYLPHYARPLSRTSAEQQGKIPWQSQLWGRASGSAVTEVLNHLMVNKCWLEQEVLVSARQWQSWSLG